MNAKQQLNDYKQKHPGFWKYQNEIEEVKRLREQFQLEMIESPISEIKKMHN